jgi:hypothetical protein
MRQIGLCALTLLFTSWLTLPAFRICMQHSGSDLPRHMLALIYSAACLHPETGDHPDRFDRLVNFNPTRLVFSERCKPSNLTSALLHFSLLTVKEGACAIVIICNLFV